MQQVLRPLTKAPETAYPHASYARTARMEGLAGGTPRDGCTVVVPVDLSRRPLGILQGVSKFFASPLPAGCVEVVIAHMSYGSIWDQRLKRMVRQAQLAGYPAVHAPTTRLPDEQGIPLGRLRNIGARSASGRDLLFADIDLLLPFDSVTSARKLRERWQCQFISIPVMYLSWNASTARRAGRPTVPSTRELLELAAKDAVRGRVDGFAINSSLIFVDRDYFFSVGEFDESYNGHGFEDFDLLMRLANTNGGLTQNVLVNLPSPDPTRAVGFRSYLSRFTVPVMAEGLFAYHIHHWRPKGDGYFEARQTNYQRFCDRMIETGIVSCAAPVDIATFDARYTANLFECALRDVDPLIQNLPLTGAGASESRRLTKIIRKRCNLLAERIAVWAAKSTRS